MTTEPTVTTRLPQVASHIAELPDGLLPGGRFDRWRPLSPRYVLCDVDGTLVGTAHTATPGVGAAIADCVGSGVRLGVCTGRSAWSCVPLITQLALPGPHVVHNGAQVWSGLPESLELAAEALGDQAAGEPIASWPLAPAHARLVRDLCAERGDYVELYDTDGFYPSDHRERARRHWAVNRSQPRARAAELDLDAVEILRATVVLFDPDRLPALIAACEAAGLAAGASFAPAMPEAIFVNVTRHGVDKGQALHTATEAVGVDAREAVALGDGGNDVPMLQVAGTAIAMGQALPEVCAAAHLVAPPFDLDGAATALHAVAAWASAVSGARSTRS